MKLLRVAHEVGDNAVIVRAEGDVDMSSVHVLVAGLKAGLELALTHPSHLLVGDLRPVTYFGSAGLNAVLECHEQGAEGGVAVRLVAADARVLRPIEVTNLDSILDVYPTMDDALGIEPSGTEKPARDS
ncbi:STAS domain-containing protein [Nocardia sp. NPDC050406]|uniref:STAS domain-containing protein n=1 Tax=Nocardia sp. NPDC050406 TaxID=3364318 RepID=UPI0037A7A295